MSYTVLLEVKFAEFLCAAVADPCLLSDHVADQKQDPDANEYSRREHLSPLLLLLLMQSPQQL